MTDTFNRRKEAWSILLSLSLLLLVGGMLAACQPTNTNTVTPTPVTLPSTLTARASSTQNGLTLQFATLPAPYFLSELLPVDIFLTNATNKPVTVSNFSDITPCGEGSNVELEGGTVTFHMPTTTDHSCPAMIKGTELGAGETFAIHQLLPLNVSGATSLKASVQVLVSTTKNGMQSISNTTNPFAGHLPTLPITVSSQIPTNRVVSLHYKNGWVLVNAPSTIQSSLLYLYNVGCQDFNDQGSTGSGNYHWEPVPSGGIPTPGCPGKNIRWNLSVSAPGWAIVSGEY